LKQNHARQRAGRPPLPPRLQSRGPIEAIALYRGVRYIARPPRLQSRGPIEADGGDVAEDREDAASAATKPRPH